MALPYELLIGLRYTRAKRRNHFISFISMISMAGIGLGVAALIVVLSVMNGFQKELRTRILGVASHIQISGINGELSDWSSIAAQAAKHPEVRAAAPFVQSQAMFTFDGGVKGSLVRGIDPEMEDRVADFRATIKSGSLDDLRPGEFGVVLGADLARSLRVFTGEVVSSVDWLLEADRVVATEVLVLSIDRCRRTEAALVRLVLAAHKAAADAWQELRARLRNGFPTCFGVGCCSLVCRVLGECAPVCAR